MIIHTNYYTNPHPLFEGRLALYGLRADNGQPEHLLTIDAKENKKGERLANLLRSLNGHGDDPVECPECRAIDLHDKYQTQYRCVSCNKLFKGES